MPSDLREIKVRIRCLSKLLFQFCHELMQFRANLHTCLFVYVISNSLQNIIF